MSTPLTTDTPGHGTHMAPQLTPAGPGFEIPPLEPGDCLTRVEFERRYEAMPHVKKAELIEGVVHLPSPVRVRRHASPHADLIGWLVHYRAQTRGVCVAANGTVRMDLDNEPQPDAAMFIEPEFGGKAQISTDDYLVGGPELAAEVTASTVGIDLNEKFRVYRRNEIQEYVVWRVQDRAIDWFVLRHGDYERLALNPTGQYQSKVFPGLWLEAEAMVGGDLARVLRVLDDGIHSPAHAVFVERLRQAAQRTTS